MNGYLLWQVSPEWFGWLHYMHDKQGPQSDKGAPPLLPPPPSARPLLLHISACPLSPSEPSLSPCDTEYTRPWKMKHEICNVRATVRALLRSLSPASPALFTPHSCHKQCSLNALWYFPTRTNASHPRLTTSVDRRAQTMERPVYLDPNSPGDYPTAGRKLNIHQPPGAPQRHMLTETLHANPCLVAGPGAGCSSDELTPVCSCDF